MDYSAATRGAFAACVRVASPGSEARHNLEGIAVEQNLILAGVGGQGILTIARAISIAALRRDLHLKQAEVHGMSQRGGEVQSHLRIADHDLHSDLIPCGRADIVFSVEPLEAKV